MKSIEQIKTEIIQLNNECDLTVLLQQFYTMYYENMNRIFNGDLTLVIYDRSKTHTIENIMGDMMEVCLNGLVPNKNGEQTKYDFILAVPPILDIFKLSNILTPIENYIHILPMTILLNDITNQVEVGIDMDIVHKLQQTPKPILN